HCRVAAPRCRRPTLVHRHPLEPPDLPDVLREPGDQVAAALRMLALAAAKDHDSLHLRAVAKELESAVSLPRVVVRTDPWSQLELLQGHVHLIPSRYAQLSLLLVAPLAEVEDAANGRVRGRRDLDEIEVARVRVRARLVGAHHAELCSILGDQPYLPVIDLFVDPRGDAPVLRDCATLACFSQPE